METPFVPDGFEPPLTLVGAGFRLEPLGPMHNDRDYAAWTSSIEHIRATPGFAGWSWPRPMSLQDNLADLERHHNDFVARTGFTYSVLDGDEVVGCVYIYPMEEGPGARVHSWVSMARAELDVPLWQSVLTWLEEVWPFASVTYAGR